MRKIWLLAVVGALLTAACSVEANLLIDLNKDGSGSVGFEITMGGRLVEQAIASGEANTADFQEGLFAVPGATMTQRVEGDRIVIEALVPFEDAAGFDEAIESFREADDSDLDVQWRDDGVSITGTLAGDGIGLGDPGSLDLGDLGGLGLGDLDFGDLGLGDLGGLDDLSGLEDLGGLQGLGFDSAEDVISASVIVSLPGEVDTHNADRVLSDGRLQWDIPLDGSDLSIAAESSFGGGGFPLWAIVLIVLAALLVVVWVYSRQRQRAAAVAAIQAAGAAAGSPADVVADPDGAGDAP